MRLTNIGYAMLESMMLVGKQENLLLCCNFPSSLGSSVSGKNNIKQHGTLGYHSSKQKSLLLLAEGGYKEECGQERHVGLGEILRGISKKLV